MHGEGLNSEAWRQFSLWVAMEWRELHAIRCIIAPYLSVGDAAESGLQVVPVKLVVYSRIASPTSPRTPTSR